MKNRLAVVALLATAAVHQHFGAGDVTSKRRREEEAHVGNLGGATKEVLAASTLPLLMSH